jgi:hypothetical protein
VKVGDLVRCVWQPGAAGVDKKTQCAIPMQHTIKGEFGIIVKQHKHYHRILFSQFEYEHDLSENAFEVINESC